jgi:uncharacterized membrane protein YcaP (DUF421 family)
MRLDDVTGLIVRRISTSPLATEKPGAIGVCTGFSVSLRTSHAFGFLVKGTLAVRVQNGRLERKNMFWNHLSEHDLEEDMRLEAQTDDLSKIKTARLERSGEISFIKTAQS